MHGLSVLVYIKTHDLDRFILILRRLVCVCFLDRSSIMFVGGKIPILLMFFYSSPFLWLTFPIVFLVVSCNFCCLLYVTMLCYIILSSTILYFIVLYYMFSNYVKYMILYWILSYHIVLYYIIFYFIWLYYIISHYIIYYSLSYHITSYHIVLYYII